MDCKWKTLIEYRNENIKLKKLKTIYQKYTPTFHEAFLLPHSHPPSCWQMIHYVRYGSKLHYKTYFTTFTVGGHFVPLPPRKRSDFQTPVRKRFTLLFVVKNIHTIRPGSGPRLE